MTERSLFIRIANILAILFVIIVNGLANALPLNGQTTGEISDRFDVYFVPAGYVFSIWGLIYLELIAYGIFQALPAQRDNPRLRRVDGLFLLSCLANSTWIFLWHFEFFVLTLGVMAILLLALIGIYRGLEVRRSQAPLVERWMAHLPFSVYLGWVSVATIANATSVLDYLNWNGFGISPQVWAVVMIGVTLALAAWVTLERKDVAFLLVLVWALVGIAVKQADTLLVSAAAAIASAVAAVMALYSSRRRRFRWRA